MAFIRVDYMEFDTDDIIGKCPFCGGDIFNVPELAITLELPDETIRLIEVGELLVAYCPKCGYADLWSAS